MKMEQQAADAATEQLRRAEGELERARRVNEAMFGQEPCPCILFDGSLRPVDCNPAAVDQFGFSCKQDLLAGIYGVLRRCRKTGRRGRPIPQPERLMRYALRKGELVCELELARGEGCIAYGTRFRRVAYGGGAGLVLHMMDRDSARDAAAKYTRPDELLRAAHQVATLLMTAEPARFRESVRDCLGIIGRAVDAGGAGVWQRLVKDGRVYGRRILHWRADDHYVFGRDYLYDADYSDKPFFLECMYGSRVSSALTRELCPSEREMLGQEGIKTVLLVPLVLDEAPWGFVSFVDCERERQLDETRRNILQATGIQIASAIWRNEMNEVTRRRLQQQELMTDIAGRFLSTLDMDATMRETLAAAGGFVRAGGAALLRHDERAGMLLNTATWYGEGFEGRSLAQCIPFTPRSALYRDFIMECKPFVYAEHAAGMRHYKPFFDPGIHTFLGIPIFMEATRLWGVIAVGSFDESRHYEESDINLLRFVGSTITAALERRRAESRLLEMSAIVENSPQLIAYIDSAGRFTYFNNALLEISGYNREDVADSGLSLLFDRASAAVLLGEYLPRVTERGSCIFELPMRCRSGALREMSFTAFSVPLEGAGMGIGVIATDMTQTRQLERDKELQKIKEQALRNAARSAEEASQLKSSFLANMSHEIRTPLNGIIGFTELALDEEAPPKTRAYLEKVLESAGGLREIVDDVLDISKIEAGKLELEQIPFALDDVLDICRALGGEKARQKGVALRVEGENLPAEPLVGDPTKLRQVLLNLLSNALKFTDRGSVRLVVRAGDCTAEQAELAFEVADTGIGMTAKQVQRIFDPFTQGDSSTTRRFGGTGLGLAICKNLLEMMDSRLYVESRAGEGSVFRFTLRLPVLGAAAGAEPPVREDAPVRPVFHGEVLVCEDNAINQQVIRANLRKVGLEAVVVPNGQRCLDLLEKRPEPFDLIFMDIHMPVMDGVEATRRLRARGVKTPIVAMTASVMKTDLESYRQNGMDGALGKPFTAPELWACLRGFIAPVEEGAEFLPPEEPRNGAGRVDAEAALRNADGDRELFLRLRRDFVRGNSGTAEQLRREIGAGRCGDARRTAHTLKGLAGLLGARELRRLAAGLERQLQTPDTQVDPASLDDLEAELSAVLAQLAREDDPDGGDGAVSQRGPGPAVDREAARQLCGWLRPLLQAGDSGALDLAHRAAEAFAFAPELNRALAAQLEEYEFEAALRTLQAIQQRLEAAG